MKVAYLINQYPKPSHTFIRCEIRELIDLGLTIERVSIRGWAEEPVSVTDKQEQERTTYILKRGIIELLLHTIWLALTRPFGFLAALRTTTALARASDIGLAIHLAYLVEACWFASWAEKHVQHVHAHFGTNTATLALLARDLVGIPFSFTVHGPEEFDKPLALSLQKKIHAASFVVAITSFCRSQLFRWASYADWNKIKLVRCAPDRSFFEPPNQGTLDTSNLICVGRLCEQKGQLLLLEAVARLRKAEISVALVLAGDGPMRAEIEKAIDRLCIRDRVRITGWIGPDEVRSELLGADVLVLPSFAEGLPIVLMEAMAIGRPVISTHIAGIPELVRHKVDGYLVPAGDLESLVSALQDYCFLSPDQRRQMAASAKTRAQHMHDPRAEALKLKAAFMGTLQT